MAANIIQPQPPSFPSLAKPAAVPAGREGAPRAASVPKPYGAAPAKAARPAETLELQLARIFARHAMQQQRAQQPQAMVQASAPAGKIRGGNLDILA